MKIKTKARPGELTSQSTLDRTTFEIEPLNLFVISIPFVLLFFNLLNQLFHDQQKVHTVNPEETHRNVRDDGYDFAFQVVQELLQFALIVSHSECKLVDAISA
jgi:hypothetical protein